MCGFTNDNINSIYCEDDDGDKFINWKKIDVENEYGNNTYTYKYFLMGSDSENSINWIFIIFISLIVILIVLIIIKLIKNKNWKMKLNKN